MKVKNGKIAAFMLVAAMLLTAFPLPVRAASHSVSVTPGTITTVPGGEWDLNAAETPAVELTYEEYDTEKEYGKGAYYRWSKVSEKVNDGHGYDASCAYAGLELQNGNEEGANKDTYVTHKVGVIGYTPGTYELETQLYTKKDDFSEGIPDDKAKVTVKVDELSDSDVRLDVFDADSAVYAKDVTGQRIVDMDINETDHSVTLKADIINENDTITVEPGEMKTLSAMAMPVGDRWTNCYGSYLEDSNIYNEWQLTNRYLDMHGYEMRYRWEVSGSDEALASLVSDPAEPVGEYFRENSHLTITAKDEIESDQTLTVKAYCRLLHYEANAWRTGYVVNADKELCRTFKVTLKSGKAKEEPAIENDYSLFINSYNKWVWTDKDYTQQETPEDYINEAARALNPSFELRADLRNLGFDSSKLPDTEGFSLPEGAVCEFEWSSNRPAYVSVQYSESEGDLCSVGHLRAWRYDPVGTVITVTATVKDAEGNVLGKARTESSPIFVKGKPLGWGPTGLYADFDLSPSEGNWSKSYYGLYGQYRRLHQLHEGASPVTYTIKPFLGEYAEGNIENYDFTYKWSFKNYYVDENSEIKENDEDPYGMFDKTQDLTGSSVKILPPAALDKTPSGEWYSCKLLVDITVSLEGQTMETQQSIDIQIIPGKEEPDPKKTNSISKLMLDRSSAVMGIGSSLTLVPSALSTDGDEALSPSVRFESNKESVASVDPSTGLVSAISAGSAKITALTTDGSNKKAVCTIKVGPAAGKVTVSQKRNLSQVEAGKTLALTASFSEKKPAVKTLTWSSDREDIAVVDAKGKVTGVSEGEAVITATPAELAVGEAGSYTVTVTKAASAKSIDEFKVMVGKNELSSDPSEAYELNVGKSVSLKAVVTENGKSKKLTSKDVIFTSSDSSVLSVTPAGKVKALSGGGTGSFGEAGVICTSLADPSIKAVFYFTTWDRM